MLIVHVCYILFLLHHLFLWGWTVTLQFEPAKTPGFWFARNFSISKFGFVLNWIKTNIFKISHKLEIPQKLILETYGVSETKYAPQDYLLLTETNKNVNFSQQLPGLQWPMALRQPHSFQTSGKAGSIGCQPAQGASWPGSHKVLKLPTQASPHDRTAPELQTLETQLRRTSRFPTLWLEPWKPWYGQAAPEAGILEAWGSRAWGRQHGARDPGSLGSPAS